MKKTIKRNEIVFSDDSGNIVASLTEEKKEDNVWSIFLKGSINNECAYDIADELFALISTDNGIILDMRDTQHISGTFAEFLVQLQIRMENTEFESLPIQNMPEDIFHTLREYGCIDALVYDIKE